MPGEQDITGAAGINAASEPGGAGAVAAALEDRLKAVEADIARNLGANFASVEGEVFTFAAFEGFRLEVEPTSGDGRIALIYRPKSPGELGTLIQNLHRLSTAPAERERAERMKRLGSSVGRLSSLESNLQGGEPEPEGA